MLVGLMSRLRTQNGTETGAQLRHSCPRPEWVRPSLAGRPANWTGHGPPDAATTSSQVKGYVLWVHNIYPFTRDRPLLAVRAERDAPRLGGLGLRYRQAEQAVLVVGVRLAGVEVRGQRDRALEAAERALAVQVVAALGCRGILAAEGHLVAEHRDVDRVRVDAGQRHLDDVVVAFAVHVQRHVHATRQHAVRTNHAVLEQPIHYLAQGHHLGSRVETDHRHGSYLPFFLRVRRRRRS